MAATSLNLLPLPEARSAGVDEEFGATLSAGDISIRGASHVIRDGYIVIDAAPQANVMIGLQGPPVVELIEDGFTAEVSTRYVAFGTASRYASLSAATCFPASAVPRPSFYPEVRFARSDFWWTLDQQPLSSAYKLLDRRLDPLYERLDQIEQGEWDAALGTKPNSHAISAARLVLHALNGKQLAPNRLVGADEQLVLYFSSGRRFSNIEIMNNRMMFVAHGEGSIAMKPERFKMRSLASVLDAIRAHLA